MSDNESASEPVNTPTLPVDVSSESAESKPKRKRNKPTHSCTECVKRKSKCRRERPICSACLERKTAAQCQYLDDEYESPVGMSSDNRAIPLPNYRFDRSLSQLPRPSSSPFPTLLRQDSFRPQLPLPTPSISLTPSFESARSFEDNAKLPPIGRVVSAHPFEAFWSTRGGLREVVEQIPAKEQCDILIDRFFESVDPLYPIVYRPAFLAEYNSFFATIAPLRNTWDAAWVARLFAVLAAGSQYQTIVARQDEAQKTTNFYMSAAHQALKLASFMSNPSLLSIHTMVIFVYALMNAGHVMDGWSFSGIIIRQAQSIGIHRSPGKQPSGLDTLAKQERIRLWQTVRMQDTFLALLLSKPALAISTDCSIHDIAVRDNNRDEEYDLHFLRAMWEFTTLIQTRFTEPIALGVLPIPTTEKRDQILSECERIWQSMVPELRFVDEAQIAQLYAQNPRIVNQMLFLRNNYYNCIMLTHQLSQSLLTTLRTYSDAAIDAAMGALDAYLLLHRLLGYKARTWWLLSYRSFTQSVLIGKCISTGGQARSNERDLRMVGYVREMIAIFELEVDKQEIALGRVAELKEFLVKAGVGWRTTA